jgi:hypothetical protein
MGRPCLPGEGRFPHVVSLPGTFSSRDPSADAQGVKYVQRQVGWAPVPSTNSQWCQLNDLVAGVGIMTFPATHPPIIESCPGGVLMLHM